MNKFLFLLLTINSLAFSLDESQYATVLSAPSDRELFKVEKNKELLSRFMKILSDESQVEAIKETIEENSSASVLLCEKYTIAVAIGASFSKCLGVEISKNEIYLRNIYIPALVSGATLQPLVADENFKVLPGKQLDKGVNTNISIISGVSLIGIGGSLTYLVIDDRSSDYIDFSDTTFSIFDSSWGYLNMGVEFPTNSVRFMPSENFVNEYL